MDTYSIGQVAKIVGLPVKTIRFYEESGVLSGVSRKENGYRAYNNSTVEELKLLKYARDLGLPLGEIKKLMRGCENGDCEHSADYIKSTVDNYLTLLADKLSKLNTLKLKLKKLRSSLDENKCKDGVYCCDILRQIISFTRKGDDLNE